MMLPQLFRIEGMRLNKSSAVIPMISYQTAAKEMAFHSSFAPDNRIHKHPDEAFADNRRKAK